MWESGCTEESRHRRSNNVVIVGGGPAGSTAALCLRKLGRDATVLERAKFPRYRIGESLLPGTMAILSRLGVIDKVEAANFTVKRAATFCWGADRPPWSFTFATPQTAPWVFGHALQVTRGEYDKILLDAAAERGAIVREQHEVTDFRLPSADGPLQVFWKNCAAEGREPADFLIDASGLRGVVSQKLTVRQWDRYYRNMAIWSYWKGGRRYKGDLEGNTFSVSFGEGWIWIIPLKGDLYSIGVVTAIENNQRIREAGAEAFYLSCLQQCSLATDVLGTATMCDEVHVLREWSYEAKVLSQGPTFFCGDAACFIDPLFSQGVHLATYSGMLAAAAIDYLYDHPEDTQCVHAWYEQAYRAAYNRYHKFVAAFYALNQEPDSKFWSSRKIEGAQDHRFDGKAWFSALTGETSEPGADGIDEFQSSASTLAELWQHGVADVNDSYDASELGARRVLWAQELMKQFRRLVAIHWKGDEAHLLPSFRVNTTTFKLERRHYIGDGKSRSMRAYGMSEGHRQLFESMITEPLSFHELIQRLTELKGEGSPIQIVERLFAEGLLHGCDRAGQQVVVRIPLQFGGVGCHDDLS